MGFRGSEVQILSPNQKINIRRQKKKTEKSLHNPLAKAGVDEMSWRLVQVEECW